MKRILLLTVLILSMIVGNVYAEDVIHLCTLTFTNITTIHAPATSCSGLCKKNKNCAIDTSSGEQLHIEWTANNKLHTATDWDVELWTSRDVIGAPFKYYTDAATAEGALASIGSAADTEWTITIVAATGIMTVAWDGDGTDPTPETALAGNIIVLAGFTESGNNGVFDILTSTSAGNGSFTVYNPSAVADTNEKGAAVFLYHGANVAGSVGATPGASYTMIKISANALAVYGTVDVSTTKRD